MPYLQKTLPIVPVVKRDTTLEQAYTDTNNEGATGAEKSAEGGANIIIWIESSGVFGPPSMDVQLQHAHTAGGTYSDHPSGDANFTVATATTTISAAIPVYGPYMRLVLDGQAGVGAWTMTIDYAGMHLIP